MEAAIKLLASQFPFLADLVRWSITQGWAPILSFLNLILIVRVLFWMHNQNKEVVRAKHAALDAADRSRTASNMAMDAKQAIANFGGTAYSHSYSGRDSIETSADGRSQVDTTFKRRRAR